MRVLSVSVTEAGRRLATRLPFEHAHGDARATVRGRWKEVDGFVLLLAAGAAVRIVAPLLEDKRTDPAVVCLDDAARYAVALCGGHRRGGANGAEGANALARQVASLLGAQAVVTTATDATGTCPLDALPGFVAGGDVAGVTAAILDGRGPAVDNPLSWPLPAALPRGSGPERVVVTDEDVDDRCGMAVLRPPTLVAGIGTSTGAPPEEVAGLLSTSLTEAGLQGVCVAEVASIDRRADEPALRALGRPLRVFPAESLRRVSVPTPSAVVRSAVGTPSVAEAAALLAAGPGGELVITKRTSPHAAVAVARRRQPRGHLDIVGLGPGAARHRTPAAEAAVRHCDILIGYGPYVDQCGDLVGPHHEVVRYPIGSEEGRARAAVDAARSGRHVALVCSGDAGVYAMASIALELMPEVCDDAGGFDLEVVPGITAATAAAAALGAPLGHDHAAISLSDLLTPWATIEARLEAVAAGDLVVSLYNPRSRGRPWQLEAARRILLTHRAPTTPVGVATDLSRGGEHVAVTTLADLDPDEVGMTTCVVVGSSATRLVEGRMVTPRGYRR